MRKNIRHRVTRLTNNRNTDDDLVAVTFIAVFICAIVFLIIGAIFQAV